MTPNGFGIIPFVFLDFSAPSVQKDDPSSVSCKPALKYQRWEPCMSCNICYRKTSYFARCKVSLPDPEKSLWRWKLSTLIDEWHAGISQLNDFRKKRQTCLATHSESCKQWWEEESSENRLNPRNMNANCKAFLTNSCVSSGILTDMERFVFVNSSMCLTCLLPGFYHSCIWGFDGNTMNMRLLASVAWTSETTSFWLQTSTDFVRNDDNMSYQTKMERIRSSKTKKQKNQKQLQAIGYFRPPVLLLFLTKTGGTMRWALRLYQNRSRWLNEKLLRFCASHFSGCTRPGKSGVGGKIPWRRQWIDGLYAICINL